MVWRGGSLECVLTLWTKTKVLYYRAVFSGTWLYTNANSSTVFFWTYDSEPISGRYINLIKTTQVSAFTESHNVPILNKCIYLYVTSTSDLVLLSCIRTYFWIIFVAKIKPLYLFYFILFKNETFPKINKNKLINK